VATVAVAAVVDAAETVATVVAETVVIAEIAVAVGTNRKRFYQKAAQAIEPLFL